jgi:hypothetical protein
MHLDVFLWGCVEDYIYRTSVDVSATLCAKIMKSVLTHMWDELVSLPAAMRVTRDVHVEVEHSTYIRGLSGKLPNISRKNFPVLP